MTSWVLRIAALFLLSIPGVCAADFADDADPSDAVQEDLPNAVAVGLFCGGIVRHEYGLSKITYKNIEIIVDVGDNINVVENGVLLKQIKSTDYSTFGQCLYATLDAMRAYSK